MLRLFVLKKKKKKDKKQLGLHLDKQNSNLQTYGNLRFSIDTSNDPSNSTG